MSSHISQYAVEIFDEILTENINSDEFKEFKKISDPIISLIQSFKGAPGYYGALNLIIWAIDRHLSVIKNMPLHMQVKFLLNACAPWGIMFGCQHIFQYLSNSEPPQ